MLDIASADRLRFRLESAYVIPLLVAVLLAPFLFGSVLPWTWALIAIYVGALLFWFGARAALGRQAINVRSRRLIWIIAPFALVVLWIGVQIAPFTPPEWHNPIWAATSATLGVPVPGRISVSPFDTLGALTKLLTYGGIFWLAVQYGRASRQALLGLQALVIAGGVYAFYGLIAFGSGTETILWFPKTAYKGHLTSTFVNRNTYATYAGLGLVCATIVVSRQLGEALDAPGWRERFRRILASFTGWGALWPVIWAALFSALLLTHSRGGFISTLVGLTAMLLAVLATPAVSFRGLALRLLPLLVLALGFFAVGGEITSERLRETDWGREERHQVYEMTLDRIRANPLLGTGYGTFADVFLAYRTENMRMPFDMAHNTYLENALELGVPAAALLLLSIGAALVRCIIGLRVRMRDTGFPVLGIGATALVGTHAFVDFSIQIPAVAITYAFILGLAVAQSWSARAPLS